MFNIPKKLKKIEIKSKDIKELSVSLEQAFNQNNKEIQEVFAVILEEIYKKYAYLNIVLRILSDEIKEQSGIEIELSLITEKAHEIFKKEWATIKKTILSSDDFFDPTLAKQIDDIFSDKKRV